MALRRAKEDARRGRFTETPTFSRPKSYRGRTPPASVAEVLLAMFGERGLGYLCHPTSASVITQWDSLVGPVARHVIPVGFDEDTAVLTLRCDSTAWLTQVRLIGDALLKRISDELGPGKVRGFHLVKGVVPEVPRPVETSDVAHAVAGKPRSPLPDPDIEAARRRQAQRMPRESAPRARAF
ncbi:DciA family protein [Streptomyces chartreusis]|uniref:DciA family protein n=1 Tax=Streptomyces chartreusis TaxID=1969 RepID=UPI003683D070